MDSAIQRFNDGIYPLHPTMAHAISDPSHSPAHSLPHSLTLLFSPSQHPPFHHILHILHNQLPRPQYRTVRPPLRMKIEHNLIGQLAVSTGIDDVLSRTK